MDKLFKKPVEERRILDRSFLGKGWSFPPTFRLQTRTVDMVAEDEDIHQSLYLLIATIPNERLMNPSYGCDLNSLVFERISQGLRQEIISMVAMAILRFEPRVDVNEIDVRVSSEDYGTLLILVDYTVRTTNSRSNMVFPFYLKEGTNLSNR